MSQNYGIFFAIYRKIIAILSKSRTRYYLTAVCLVRQSLQFRTTSSLNGYHRCCSHKSLSSTCWSKPEVDARNSVAFMLLCFSLLALICRIYVWSMIGSDRRKCSINLCLRDQLYPMWNAHRRACKKVIPLDYLHISVLTVLCKTHKKHRIWAGNVEMWTQ